MSSGYSNFSSSKNDRIDIGERKVRLENDLTLLALAKLVTPPIFHLPLPMPRQVAAILPSDQAPLAEPQP